MNDTLFSDLDLPHSDENLGVDSGSHAVRTVEVKKRFKPVNDSYSAQGVFVVGDEFIPDSAKGGRIAEFWNGNAAERIAAHLSAGLAARVSNKAPAEVT